MQQAPGFFRNMKMRQKILHFFFTFTILLSYVPTAYSAGYTCDGIKQYTSCNSGYYLTKSGTGNSCATCSSVNNTSVISTTNLTYNSAVVGKRTQTCNGKYTGGPSNNTTVGPSSCTGCSSSTYSCSCNSGYKVSGSGSTCTCVPNNITVSCPAGKYIRQGQTSCIDCVSNGAGGTEYGYYCPGFSSTSIPATGATSTLGRTQCPQASGLNISAYNGDNSTSNATKIEHCMAMNAPFSNTQGSGVRRCFWTSGSGSTAVYTTNCHWYHYNTCNAGYQMTKDGAYNGTPQDNNDCIACAIGYYKISAGTAACSACTSYRTNTTTTGTTSTSTSQCLCKEGYYLSGSTCIDPGDGYYSGISNSRIACSSSYTNNKTVEGYSTTTSLLGSFHSASPRSAVANCSYTTGAGEEVYPAHTITLCYGSEICAGGTSVTYANTGGWKGISSTECTGYTADSQKGKSSCNQTKISVAAGKQVATAKSATLTTPAGTNWYTLAHTVPWGSTSSSSSNVKSCTYNSYGYKTPNTTTQTDHDAANDCKKTITLNKNGGTGTIQGTTGTASASITCSQGEACNFGSASGLTQTGYTFKGGWGTSQSCKSTTTSFTNPTTTPYYACKSPNTYTISYTLNSGTQASSGVPTSYTYGVGATVNGTPTRSGYTFEGWCTDSALTSCAKTQTIATTATGAKTFYAKWSINATISNQSKVYDGSALTCSGVTGTPSGATIKYGTASGTYNLTSAPTRTDAGTTTVYYQITATNAVTRTGSFTCTVTQANNPITLSASSGTIAYPNSGTFTVSNAQGAVTVSSGTTTVATASISGSIVTVKSVKPGSSTITVTAAGNTNYKSGSKTYAATVVKGTNPITLSASSGSTTFPATKTFMVSNAQGTVTVSSSATGVATAAISSNTVTMTPKATGSATITATAAGNDYYNQGSKTYALTVNAGTITATANTKTLTYNGTTTTNGSAQSCANVTSVTPSGASVTYSTASNGTFSATAPTLTNTGSMTVYYKIMATNYTTKTGSYTCIMNAKAMTVSHTNKTLTYNGSAQSCGGNVSVSVPSSGASVTYSTSSTGTFSATAPTLTNAGSTTVYYKVTGANFTEKTGSYTCKMNKAACTLALSATSGNMAYSSTKTFTISGAKGTVGAPTSSNTNVATVAISGTTVTMTSKTGYGTSTITVTDPGNSNYNGCSKTYALTVDMGTITLNNQSATSAGTTAIYQRYNVNVYNDSARSKAMTSSANAITKPTKTGHTFVGYYDSTSYGTQYINANGYITDAGLTAGKALKANGTWYAKWTVNTYTITYKAGTGGSGADQTQSVTYKSSFTTKASDTFSKANATFAGWSASSGSYPNANTAYTYTTVGNITLTATWNCNAGYTLNSSTGACVQCSAGTYKNNVGNGECTSCNTATSGNYPNSDAGADAITKCYSNSKSRAWTGSQTACDTPTNSYSHTCNSCSGSACSYVAYSNSAGTGDGTVKSGCSTNNAACKQSVRAFTCKASYYVNGSACSLCNSFASGGYPNSADGNSGGKTACYSNSKSRAWTGSQNDCVLPTNCYSKTCNNCNIAACSYVAYANSAGTGDGTIKSGCSTNNASCNQTVKSVTAKANYYVDGIACTACNTVGDKTFTQSVNGNTGGASACYKSCSKACTQPTSQCPANSSCTYSATSTSGTYYYGGSCSAATSTCDILSYTCNSGYNKTYTGACSQMCTAGVTSLRTSTNVSVPLYAVKQTTPAINIKMPSGTVCYGNLVSGTGDGINVKYGNTLYHTTQ